MNKKKHLAGDDVNRLDCACESVNDRKVVSEPAKTEKRIVGLNFEDDENLYQNLKLNLLGILDNIESTEAIEKLKTDIISCRDVDELGEHTSLTLKFLTDVLNDRTTNQPMT